MTDLYIAVVIVVGMICCLGLWCYFGYKTKQLEYQKVCGKQNAEISIKALELEIEKEHTKQMEIDADAFKAKEITKQYEIKASCKEKYDTTFFL